MLGFDITKIEIPKIEKYHQPPEDNVKDKAYGPLRERWVFQVDSDYWIWQWAEDQKTLEESEVYKLYLKLIKYNLCHMQARKVFSKTTSKRKTILMTKLYQSYINQP